MGTYLIHHGIRGQRWGKKNGPPYPLKPNDRSREEQKLNSVYKSGRELDFEISKEQSKINDQVLKEVDNYAKKKYGKSANALLEEAQKEPRDMPWDKSAWKKMEDIEWYGYDLYEELPKRSKRLKELQEEQTRRSNEYVNDFIRRNGKMSVSDLNRYSTSNDGEYFKDAEYILDTMDWNSFNFEVIGNEYVFTEKRYR